jgi:hypothetical protein
MDSMPAKPALNAVDAAIIDELDEQIEWLGSEAIREVQARLSTLTDHDYPEAIALLGRIDAYKTVEQRLSSLRERIVKNPSETQWVRING